MQTRTAPTQVAKDRADLIKRLFAVSLSVGFASQVAKIIDAKFTTGSGIQDFMMLSVSATVVVLSWEGYLGALQDFPLEDVFRFYLDIIIVFLYLVLLACSHSDTAAWWSYVIDIIFISYIVWDLLTKYVYPDQYRGLLPTVVWSGYLILLSLLMDLRALNQLYVVALFVLWGIVLYRIDKIRNFSWKIRVFCIIIPIICSFVLTRYF